MDKTSKNVQHPVEVKEKSGNCWENTLKHYKYEEKLSQKTEFLPVEKTDCLYYCDKRVYEDKGDDVLTVLKMHSIKKYCPISGLKEEGVISSDFPKDGKVVIISDGNIPKINKGSKKVPLFWNVPEVDRDNFLFNELALKFVNKEEYDKFMLTYDAEEDKKEVKAVAEKPAKAEAKADKADEETSKEKAKTSDEKDRREDESEKPDKEVKDEKPRDKDCDDCKEKDCDDCDERKEKDCDDCDDCKEKDCDDCDDCKEKDCDDCDDCKEKDCDDCDDRKEKDDDDRDDHRRKGGYGYKYSDKDREKGYGKKSDDDDDDEPFTSGK